MMDGFNNDLPSFVIWFYRPGGLGCFNRFNANVGTHTCRFAMIETWRGCHIEA